VDLTLQRENGEVVCDPCVLADNPFTRTKGLLGRASLEPGEGLLLATSGIHTCFMRFPIDVVFLDEELMVIGAIKRLNPWRIVTRRGAKATVELAAGEIDRHGLEPGERLAVTQRATNGAANGIPAAPANGRLNGHVNGRLAPVRVLVSTNDPRFERVASFLLAREGFNVDATHDSDRVLSAAANKRTDVVVLDGSPSLAAAARAVRALAAVGSSVGVVVVTDANVTELQTLATVPKWGPFEAIVGEIERAHARTRAHDIP
jgi:uncharacterized membrane protein (UPF0127 family)/CheY-like chemotaxis protein